MAFLRNLFFGGLALFVSAATLQAASLVFLIGEDEYKTWETLPEFAKTDLEPLGHKFTIIHADSVDKNHFPGIVEALRGADALMVSVRRRTPHKEELEALQRFVAEGKPVVGIRTASHAFALLPKATLSDPALAIWQEFDSAILGGNYAGHHRGEDKTSIGVAPGAEKHAILTELSLSGLVGNGTLYKNSPLAGDSTPLLIGSIPNQPAEPVAWTHLAGPRKARVFYTSLGHPDDFKNAEFRRLLRNGFAWALAK